ncbi:MAG: universal stress protein [bacterium]
MKPTKVLVAIDGSECSARALAAGAEQARLSGAALAIVYAVDPLPALSPEFIPTAGIFEELRLAGEELLKKTAAGLCPAPHTFLRQGRPDYEVVACAKQWGADLLVLGTHGRTGLGRVLLGSVAEHVVRHAPCSVLVVRGK